MIVVSEFGNCLDVSSGTGKTVEDSCDVCTWLHRDDSELIFFVDPDEEGLVVVVEDTSASWPVTVEAASLKETISLPK